MVCHYLCRFKVVVGMFFLNRLRMSNMLKKLFSLFGGNEEVPDSQALLAPMEAFDKPRVKDIVRRWLLYIDAHETVPADIVALNFNLWEAAEENGDSCYTLELTGSRHYDAEDDDWACEEDFEPRERNCDNLQLSSRLPWEEVLNTLVEVLKELKDELADISLFRVEHITAGFTDGDLITIK